MPHPPQEEPDRGQNGNLRSERFCGRNADFRAGVHVNTTVAFPGDCAGDVITNSKRAITFAPALPQGTEGVRRFTTLADRENKGVARHRCVAVAKLAGEFYFSWNLGERLNQIFADHRSVQSGAAAGENNPADI